MEIAHLSPIKLLRILAVSDLLWDETKNYSYYCLKEKLTKEIYLAQLTLRLKIAML